MDFLLDLHVYDLDTVISVPFLDLCVSDLDTIISVPFLRPTCV